MDGERKETIIRRRKDSDKIVAKAISNDKVAEYGHLTVILSSTSEVEDWQLEGSLVIEIARFGL